MKPALRVSLALFLVLTAAAGMRAQCGRPAPALNCNYNGLTHILVADGAGAYSTLANNLHDVIEGYCLPPYVHPVLIPIEWSTGDNLYDYRSRKLHLQGAAKMAGEVQRIRRSFPDSPIILIGYSAGASVVLFAAEMLPCGSVDDIILLGPTVASCYDVRQALKATKCGIDHFYIPGDDWFEQVETMWGAPYDRPGSTLAGKTGFTMLQQRGCTQDPLLCKFREHQESNVQGDHYGLVRPPFLCRRVMRIIPRGTLLPPRCESAPK